MEYKSKDRNTKNKPEYKITDTPPANPSNPSIQLKALVTPGIQIIVISSPIAKKIILELFVRVVKLKKGNTILSRNFSENNVIEACKNSLGIGFIVNKSSIKPIKKNKIETKKRYISCLSNWKLKIFALNNKEIEQPRTIDIPPILTIIPLKSFLFS